MSRLRRLHSAGPRSPKRSPGPAVQQLLFLLDTAYDHASWHGPNLRGSLRGVTPAQAAWRPADRRHNIWELAVHAAYWKYVAWQRLTGAKRGSFAAQGSNFLTKPHAGRATLAAWKGDLILLHQAHATLRAAVSALSDSDLDTRPPVGTASRRALLTGVAAHDLYHAGQIQLLKRLQ